MPMKKDDSGRHWVAMEFLVPGTPEQVCRPSCSTDPR